MKSTKKSVLSLVAVVVATVSLFGMPAKAATSGSPSAGALLVGRAAAKDGNGIVFANGNSDVGYKVFVVSDALPHQLVDESGLPAVNGLINKVCVGEGTTTEYALAYDSASSATFTTANVAANALAALTEPTYRSGTASVCQVYDAQFSYGAVVLLTGVTGGATAHVYWRPSRGGAN